MILSFLPVSHCEVRTLTHSWRFPISLLGLFLSLSLCLSLLLCLSLGFFFLFILSRTNLKMVWEKKTRYFFNLSIWFFFSLLFVSVFLLSGDLEALTQKLRKRAQNRRALEFWLFVASTWPEILRTPVDKTRRKAMRLVAGWEMGDNGQGQTISRLGLSKWIY